MAKSLQDNSQTFLLIVGASRKSWDGRSPTSYERDVMALGDREQIAAAGQPATLVIEPMPYHPPPTDPKLLPRWYEELYAKQKQWVEKLNVVLGRANTT
jgi:hypothetical protein